MFDINLRLFVIEHLKFSCRFAARVWSKKEADDGREAADDSEEVVSASGPEVQYHHREDFDNDEDGGTGLTCDNAGCESFHLFKTQLLGRGALYLKEMKACVCPMDQHLFVFATRGHCMKGKQCQHIGIKNKNLFVFKTI